MATEKILTLQMAIDTDGEAAAALVQLVKRITYNECRANAVDDAEARAMIRGTEALRKALCEVGYCPR